MLTNNHYVQPLKLAFFNRKVIAPGAAYNSLITKPTYERPQFRDYKIKAWMRFNSNTFDGAQLIASLVLDNKFKSIGSCTFKLYSIDPSSNWTETLRATLPGTALSPSRFAVDVSEALVLPADFTGELTYRLEVELTRYAKVYRDTFYFNHVGIYGSLISLKNKVEFLDITKLDE
jgi:hypothetical protein